MRGSLEPLLFHAARALHKSFRRHQTLRLPPAIKQLLSPIRKSVLPVLVFLLEYCHYDRNHSVFSQTLSANPRFGEKFGDNYAVDNIDLDIYQNEIFALLGSSGSGKSTLLRMLAGMESPNQGKIILDGQDITKLAPYDRPINMMFQSYALFPHMTVEQTLPSV
ncbi:ABC transporter ATP-binding protein, polyamine [Neisseria gonorrhoeae]|uniref:ABC transporter ATP-binding protein, polyamine n=1 Tax=Neisseria gonorrhoeae TaxID=485 RepID=A0A378W0W3_NEIGO|nr:ABC transporter ATP-binding protein, polyamine [Neisseria gonorrhoeae]